MQEMNSMSPCYRCDGYEYVAEDDFLGITSPEKEGCLYGYWGNLGMLWNNVTPPKTKKGRLRFCKRKVFLGRMKYRLLRNKNYVNCESFPGWLW